ncbi:hypothetical protein Pfo_005931, partial [Paulownia fortunei]
MAAPSCTTIDSKLVSCVTYIEGHIMVGPSSACCAGVEAIVAEATTKKDQVAICKCLKVALVQLGNLVVLDRFSDLPKECGIPIILPPIDKNFDCSKYVLNGC